MEPKLNPYTAKDNSLPHPNTVGEFYLRAILWEVQASREVLHKILNKDQEEFRVKEPESMKRSKR